MKIFWNKMASMGPGAFKLHHLQPIGPILFKGIFNFFTFILGGFQWLGHTNLAIRSDFVTNGCVKK